MFCPMGGCSVWLRANPAPFTLISVRDVVFAIRSLDVF